MRREKSRSHSLLHGGLGCGAQGASVLCVHPMPALSVPSPLQQLQASHSPFSTSSPNALDFSKTFQHLVDLTVTRHKFGSRLCSGCQGIEGEAGGGKGICIHWGRKGNRWPAQSNKNRKHFLQRWSQVSGGHKGVGNFRVLVSEGGELTSEDHMNKGKGRVSGVLYDL